MWKFVFLSVSQSFRWFVCGCGVVGPLWCRAGIRIALSYGSWNSPELGWQVVSLVVEVGRLLLEIHAGNVDLIEGILAHVHVLQLCEDKMQWQVAKCPDFLKQEKREQDASRFATSTHLINFIVVRLISTLRMLHFFNHVRVQTEAERIFVVDQRLENEV